MLPWLLPGAKLSIARLVSQLKFEDTGDTLWKAPLQEHHLQSLLPLCNLDDAHDLLMVTILYMGHDGLLRSGEIVSGLRPRDVIWGPGRTSMSVRFARSKTHRTDLGSLRGIPSTLVDGILQVIGVPAHAYWERR